VTLLILLKHLMILHSSQEVKSFIKKETGNLQKFYPFAMENFANIFSKMTKSFFHTEERKRKLTKISVKYLKRTKFLMYVILSSNKSLLIE
jgi:hypothetical protein